MTNAIRAGAPARAAGRDRVDRCPGALTLHEAADGLLARVRLPGGDLSTAALTGLAETSKRLGDGVLELTSRGNVQLRGITDGDAVAEAIADVGLLPSATHERVRNIVASPLAGLDRPGPRLSELVARLDSDLRATPELAALSGRFLFAVDDGRGDMLPLGPDVFALRTGVRWLVRPADVEVSTEEVASVMLVTATAFAGMAGSAWRIADLPEGTERVGSATRERVCRLRTAGLPPPSAPPEPAGALHQIDGRWTVVVLAPLGRLSAGQAGVLARHPGTMRITPWRSVVIADLSDPVPLLAAAADAGLGTGRDSRWYGVSACTGRPGCGKAQADVRADAAAASPAGERIHWSGCPRRCGQPHGPHLEMVAAGAGYEMGRS